MWYLERVDPYPFFTRGKFISFIGAGGKTSLAEYIARQAGNRGKRVALTTTTKIWAKEPYRTLEDKGLRGDFAGPIVRVGKSVMQGKLTGLEAEEVRALGDSYDLVLIEADGAKGRPLKYPALYEPVIPPCSDFTVVVAGLDGLGGPIEEKVFRWQLFTEATGLPPDREVTVPVLLRLFEGDGLMKGVEEKSRSLVLLNKYDACKAQDAAPELAGSLLRRTGTGRVLVASVLQGLFYGLGS